MLIDVLMWCVVGAILGGFVAEAYHRRRDARRELDAPQSQPPAAEPEPSAWHALSGGSLELGDTGFMIKFLPQHPAVDFVLESPEGLPMIGVRQGQLDALMQAAETFADERKRFAPGKQFPAVRRAKNHNQ